MGHHTNWPEWLYIGVIVALMVWVGAEAWNVVGTITIIANTKNRPSKFPIIGDCRDLYFLFKGFQDYYLPNIIETSWMHYIYSRN